MWIKAYFQHSSAETWSPWALNERQVKVRAGVIMPQTAPLASSQRSRRSLPGPFHVLIIWVLHCEKQERYKSDQPLNKHKNKHSLQGRSRVKRYQSHVNTRINPARRTATETFDCKLHFSNTYMRANQKHFSSRRHKENLSRTLKAIDRHFLLPYDLTLYIRSALWSFRICFHALLHWD